MIIRLELLYVTINQRIIQSELIFKLVLELSALLSRLLELCIDLFLLRTLVLVELFDLSKLFLVDAFQLLDFLFLFGRLELFFVDRRQLTSVCNLILD